VSKTAYIAEGVYIYESTDTYGNGICYPYGVGEFNTTVNGEPVAISSSGSGEIFRGRTRYWLQRWLPAGSCVHYPYYALVAIPRPVLVLPRLALTKLPSLVICRGSQLAWFPATSTSLCDP
jgi:hypothetical protein